jgi:hypothetical protein
MDFFVSDLVQRFDNDGIQLPILRTKTSFQQ